MKRFRLVQNSTLYKYVFTRPTGFRVIKALGHHFMWGTKSAKVHYAIAKLKQVNWLTRLIPNHNGFDLYSQTKITRYMAF